MLLCKSLEMGADRTQPVTPAMGLPTGSGLPMVPRALSVSPDVAAELKMAIR